MYNPDRYNCISYLCFFCAEKRRNTIRSRVKEAHVERPHDETEVIADIYRRIDEIQSNLEHERRQRKKLSQEFDK